MLEFKSFCVSIFGKMTCMFRKNNVKSSYGYCKTIIAQKEIRMDLRYAKFWLINTTEKTK